jgi:hypothetical protein
MANLEVSPEPPAEVPPRGSHPAILRSKALIRHFTERDRLAVVPEMPSEAEAEVLISLMLTCSLSLSGSSIQKKLAGLRCIWWDWCQGQHWTGIHRIQPGGRAALGRWLTMREAVGDERAADLRRRWFPTAGETTAAQARRAVEDRRHDALHALRVRGIDLAHTETHLRHLLQDLALRIGRGANNLDELVAEIKQVTERLDGVEAERATLQTERDRILRESS